MNELTSPDRAVLTDKVLSHAVYTASIDAPIDRTDIAEWLRTLPDGEYQRCAPPDHTAAGYTVSDDGRPMSINVEMIGTGLVAQHYVNEITEKAHRHMVSISDVLTPAGWTTTVQVLWDLKADPIDEHSSRYTTTVTSHPTAGFMRFIEAQWQTFEKTPAAHQAASGDHCRRDTALYAASLGRHANRTKYPKETQKSYRPETGTPYDGAASGAVQASPHTPDVRTSPAPC